MPSKHDQSAPTGAPPADEQPKELTAVLDLLEEADDEPTGEMTVFSKLPYAMRFDEIGGDRKAKPIIINGMNHPSNRIGAGVTHITKAEWQAILETRHPTVVDKEDGSGATIWAMDTKSRGIEKASKKIAEEVKTGFEPSEQEDKLTKD
jgi:hypothetical protein